MELLLSNGTMMPKLGLGVYMVSDAATCESAVKTALGSGYRLVDTAVMYGNERPVGRGIRASDVAREDVFVTTKLWPSEYGAEKAPAAIGRSLERLGCDYIDLLLLHQPVGDVLATWGVMEAAVAKGAVRSLGVSNFTITDLERLLAVARIRPVVDQVELHPYWQQRELIRFLTANDIVPEAWYPIGHGSKKLLSESVITEIARRHGKTAVQVILGWHVQSGHVAIPKSTNPAHIRENLDIFDIELAPHEMTAIASLDQNRPMFRMPRWLKSAIFPLVRSRQLP
jgi:diketogulonate reductase-like aldo/keto reductase